MIGPQAAHIAYLPAWACRSGLTVAEVQEGQFSPPLPSDGARIALRSLNRALEMGPAAPPRCLDCGPGA